MTAWIQASALAVGTFVSEDLTCIAAGLSVRSRDLDPIIALIGCFMGIYLGDLGLWGIGRLLGPRLLRARWVAAWLGRTIPEEQVRGFGEWFDRHTAAAVLAGRVVPGSRLPLYLAAGCSGRGAGRFFFWAAVAALLWVPFLVLLAAWLGDAIVGPAEAIFGVGRIAVAVGAVVLFLLLVVARCAVDPLRRARIVAAVSRIWRWEFWPAWLFYLPVLPWIAWLSIRHGGFATVTAANPSIPDGGFVGESKHAILSRLPQRWTAPSIRIGPGEPEERIGAARRALDDLGWRPPLIGKPDVGQRGVGVRVLRTHDDVAAYLRAQPAAAILQIYHPGPHEAGIFYVRHPGEPAGRIFSITDKHFPEVVGDGSSTLEEIIWRHPRHRMQARTFLARHARQLLRVPAAGERILLGHAGNHSQGTMFTDGSHLITPALERVVDEIARSVEGFYFGRFDVRYGNPDDFKAGRDLTVVELNGVTSESTNIYDPSRSILWAYRTLFRQWALLFRIGAASRDRGAATTPHRRLLAAIAACRREAPALPIAD